MNNAEALSSGRPRQEHRADVLRKPSWLRLLTFLYEPHVDDNGCSVRCLQSESAESGCSSRWKGKGVLGATPHSIGAHRSSGDPCTFHHNNKRTRVNCCFANALPKQTASCNLGTMYGWYDWYPLTPLCMHAHPNPKAASSIEAGGGQLQEVRRHKYVSQAKHSSEHQTEKGEEQRFPACLKAGSTVGRRGGERSGQFGAAAAGQRYTQQPERTAPTPEDKFLCENRRSEVTAEVRCVHSKWSKRVLKELRLERRSSSSHGSE